MITTEIKRVKNHINGEWVESTGTEVEAVPNQRLEKLSLTFHYLQKKMLKKLLKRQSDIRNMV